MQGRNAALVSKYFPSYRSPKLVYQDLLLREMNSKSVWLDLGCGKRAVRDDAANEALPRVARLAVGCDLDSGLRHHSSIKNLVRCDGTALPFRNGTFNIITAAMVVEHLKDPAAVFAEVARVCRPEARFVVFTPNVLNYGMIIARITPHVFHIVIRKFTHYVARREWKDFDDDIFPTWYRANRLGRLRRLLNQAGFAEQRLERLPLAHSFGFLKFFYVASLLFERCIDQVGLGVLKADLLAVFRRSDN